MSRPRVLYDGLSRCLCPALDRISPPQALRIPISIGASRLLTKPGRRVLQRRLYSTSNGAEALYAERQAVQVATEQWKPMPAPDARWEEVFLAPTPPTERVLWASSIATITMALSALADPKGTYNVHQGQQVNRYARILQLVRHLLLDREQPPSLSIYESLMAAMADPDGSASGLIRLWIDAENHHIQPSPTLCRNALVALAVHPDYTLRQRILSVMQQYWFAVDTSTNGYVLLGLLRDEQYEMAYSKLMEMVEEQASTYDPAKRIDLWVYDIFIMVFGQLGLLDEMISVLLRRKQAKGSDDVMFSMLYYALDICSSGFHHWGTTFAWNAIIKNNLVTPPDGVLENVLATAARRGDVDLASEVHVMIANRSRIHMHHYDALLETFINADNVEGALRILCVMERNSFPVTSSNTRAIQQALKDSPDTIDGAEKSLRHLATEQSVPSAAVEVVVNAIAANHGSEQAAYLYHDFELLCGQKPSGNIVQDMIMYCEDQGMRKKLAKDYRPILAADDGQDKTMRSSWVYRKLIPACLEIGELDLAFHFAHQALPSDALLSSVPTWLKGLIERAFEAEDGRIWPIVDRFSKVGNLRVINMVHIVGQQSKMAKEANDWQQSALKRSISTTEDLKPSKGRHTV